MFNLTEYIKRNLVGGYKERANEIVEEADVQTPEEDTDNGELESIQ